MTTDRTDPRHVVVIGAGPGLGASIAHRFGREGFAVTLLSRREQTLVALAEDLRDRGVFVETVVADAGDLPAFRATLLDLVERSSPGVVVYNVGLVAEDNLLTSEEGYLLEALTVDVVSAITAAQVLTPAMRRAGSGTFLVTGGGPALYPDPAHGTLTIGKAALRGAVSVLHDDLRTDGVHVASVVVVGVIAPDTALDPDRIADAYWTLHEQPAGEWSSEVVFDGREPPLTVAPRHPAAR